MTNVANAAPAALVSAKGVKFIGDHEGFRSRAYRDQGGVLTIGFGFTMDSRVFADWWRARYGRGLQMGDTISREDSDAIFLALLNNEYAPPVVARFGPQPANRQDQGTSTTYNAGEGTLRDRWANALAAGDVHAAAEFLKTTRTTARGVPSQGLVNRRAAEARLLEFGDYGDTTDAAVATSRDDVMAYQAQLIALGYLEGEADGIAGPKTLAAVRAFQGHYKLVVDGRVGPATRATLARAVEASVAVKTTAGAGGIGAAAGAAGTVTGNPGTDPTTFGQWASGGLLTALIVAAAVGAAFLLWRNRKRIRQALGL